MDRRMSSPSISKTQGVRVVAALQLAVFLFGIGVVCLRVLPHAWRTMNTDFPNDYVAARLVREGYTVDRIYEWEWFEEQRQRMAIDQPTAGFIPHTPFSVVPMLPFTWLAPLSAKHAWIIFSLLLLAASIGWIASLSKLPWMCIASAALLYLPLYRNLEYGQYYVLLLAVLSAALWCDQREQRFTAGLLTAFAAGLKIFPAVLVLFYLRKRDWRALGGFLVGTLVVVVASVAAFGTVACTRFMNEILPAALHGDAMNPFALPANSISAVLHNLFVFDPQQNPHPLMNAPSLVGIVGPLLLMVVLAPIVLACSRDRDPRRDSVEWSALLTVALAVSTLPASYNFIVLLLPCAVLFGYLWRERRTRSAYVCAALYLLIGWAVSPIHNPTGAMALLAVPRLWLLLALSGLFYFGLAAHRGLPLRSEWKWASAFAVLALFQMVGLVRHQSHLYDSHNFISTSGPQMFVVASARAEAQSILFHGMTLGGWRWAELDDAGRITFATPPQNETAWLVETKGRHALWTRRLDSPVQISNIDLDVYDFSVTPELPIVFSAMDLKRSLQLYEADENSVVRPLNISNARFPALSPDKRWLAYSSLLRGTWRLTIRDLASGADRRIGVAECNEGYPVWANDSHGLTYVCDCGRGLWQSAFAAVTLDR
jgi:hypothetical protein